MTVWNNTPEVALIWHIEGCRRHLAGLPNKCGIPWWSRLRAHAPPPGKNPELFENRLDAAGGRAGLGERSDQRPVECLAKARVGVLRQDHAVYPPTGGVAKG